jgi:hypothetical protein
MADKAIYAPDEESQRKYQEALDRVTQSLDARKNRLFDPTLLAMAEGFLAPTRTGGFGESLGIAAGKLRGAEEAEFKREQELAQAQLGLAQQGMQLERQKQMSQAYAQALRPGLNAPSAAPSGGAGAPAAGGAPATPAGAVPPGAPAAEPQGFQIAPPMPLSMTREQFLRNAQMEGKPLGQALKEWDEYSRKQRETKEGYVFDYGAGRAFPVPKAEQVNIQIRGYSGTYPVSQEDAMRLAALERSGDAAGYKTLADRIVKGPAGTSRVSSAEEIEQEKRRGTIIAEEEAKTESALRNDIITRADQAGNKIRVANQILTLAEDPASARMFGILNNPNFSSAVAKLVETGIGIPGFSIGVPEIQNVLRNMKLNPQEIARFQYGAMLFAQSQLEASQLAKGQGAISDFERRLFGMTAMTSEDTPGALQMKSKALIARGQFDRQVARLWNSSKGQYRSVNDFKQSDEYDRLVSEYDAKLAKLLETMPVPAMPGTPGKPGQQPKFKFE